jgi:hypothetical protein
MPTQSNTTTTVDTAALANYNKYKALAEQYFTSSPNASLSYANQANNYADAAGMPKIQGPSQAAVDQFYYDNYLANHKAANSRGDAAAVKTYGNLVNKYADKLGLPKVNTELQGFTKEKAIEEYYKNKDQYDRYFTSSPSSAKQYAQMANKVAAMAGLPELEEPSQQAIDKQNYDNYLKQIPNLLASDNVSQYNSYANAINRIAKSAGGAEVVPVPAEYLGTGGKSKTGETVRQILDKIAAATSGTTNNTPAGSTSGIDRLAADSTAVDPNSMTVDTGASSEPASKKGLFIGLGVTSIIIIAIIIYLKTR